MPVAADVAPFHLSAGKCDALILHPSHERTKAWHMWGAGTGEEGSRPWARVGGGAHMCWGSTTEQANWFFGQVRRALGRGAEVGWRLARYRGTRLLSLSPTVPALGSPLPPIDLTRLPWPRAGRPRLGLLGQLVCRRAGRPRRPHGHT